MMGNYKYLARLTMFLLLLTTHSTGQLSVLVESDLPVQSPHQEFPEPLELEPFEVPDVLETTEPPETIEPLEALEFEQPEDPCYCGIRCCANPFEFTRSPVLLNLHLPEVTSLSCCGCTSCPADYFIVPVSRHFGFSMLTSMSSFRTPG